MQHMLIPSMLPSRAWRADASEDDTQIDGQRVLFHMRITLFLRGYNMKLCLSLLEIRDKSFYMLYEACGAKDARKRRCA